MKRQTPAWQKWIFVASLAPPVFCAAMWPMSHYSELHTIAVRAPKSGLVVQHGVMVWMFGDYEVSLRALNRSARAQPSFREIMFGKKAIRKQAVLQNQPAPDDTPPAMQIAGYALMATRYDRPTIDLGFVKYFKNPNLMGYAGGHFLRFNLGQTLLASAAIPLILWLIWRARSAAALRREAQGFCSACGYDIRTASQGRCPECGTEFTYATRSLPSANPAPDSETDESTSSTSPS